MTNVTKFYEYYNYNFRLTKSPNQNSIWIDYSRYSFDKSYNYIKFNKYNNDYIANNVFENELLIEYLQDISIITIISKTSFTKEYNLKLTRSALLQVL